MLSDSSPDYMKTSHRRPKFHTFDKKRYKLLWKTPPDECRGLCSPPESAEKERDITIKPDLPPKELMEILLHEGLHAELWCLDEPTVDRIGKSFSDLLWKCGYRLT